jgi:hypothetical protein
MPSGQISTTYNIINHATKQNLPYFPKREQHQVPLPQANNTTVLMDNLMKGILTIMLLIDVFDRLRRHLIEM